MRAAEAEKGRAAKQKDFSVGQKRSRFEVASKPTPRKFLVLAPHL